MSIFTDVKSAVDIKTAAEHYGLNIRNDKACCVFHNEKTPSMKLYPDHFHCFGCNEHGDVIKLTGQLLGLSPIESAERLATDFGVHICRNYQPGRKISPSQPIVTYKEKENKAYMLLDRYCKYLEDCRVRYAPRSPDEAPHPLFAAALCESEQYKYYRDLFIFGSFEERKKFIEDNAALLYRIENVLSEHKAA